MTFHCLQCFDAVGWAAGKASGLFHIYNNIHLTALCPGLPRWTGTRKVKPIWILLKQETVSGSGISWAICKSAPRSRQITTPAAHNPVFYRPDALPATQPTVSKHWRQNTDKQTQYLVLLPLTTLGQETRWAYSTTPRSPNSFSRSWKFY